MRDGQILLDRYRVERPIARGGSSFIYGAFDDRLCRRVCVKVFAESAEPSGVQRAAYEHFVQEAFSLASLAHPSTLRIYDFGYLPGQTADRVVPFQVTEFLDGGTLATLVRTEGPLDRDETTRILDDLAGALSEAHDRGIIHRDIKPSNILFVGSGPGRMPKLVDFGIAKMLPHASDSMARHADDTEAVVGHRLGMYSPNWSAPEQFLGLRVDPSADVYSLALVSVYMLTGRVAMESASARDALERRRDSDRLVQQAIAELHLSPDAVGILTRAVCYDPPRRPLDVRRFAAELAEALMPTVRRRLRASRPTASLYASATEQRVGERRIRFVSAPGAISCAGGRGRVHVDVIHGSHGKLLLQVRGLDCFVAYAGGRPTRALQMDTSSTIELIAPDHTVLASATGTLAPDGDEPLTVHIDGRSYAVHAEDGRCIAALDFGEPHHQYIVQLPSQPERYLAR